MTEQKFTDTLKDALRTDGWHSHELCEERFFHQTASLSPRETIHIEDDTALRIEAGRLCMMCGVLFGSVLLMGILFAAAYWDKLEIAQRLTALLYGEVV